MPVVLNKLQCETWELSPNGAYVDRTTVFGNPFVLRSGVRREAILKQYAEWILLPPQRRLRRRMFRELRFKDLICHCAPLPCHADIILLIANANSFGANDDLIRERYGA
jgi:hypothetical protein